MIHDILRHTARRPQTIDYLCTKLSLSTKMLREVLAQAQKSGYHVMEIDGYVSSKTPLGPQPVTVSVQGKPGRHHVAVFTDVHFGSTYCDRNSLSGFLHGAWEKGCRVAVCSGDLLDGNKPVLIPEQRRTSFDSQVGEALNSFKKAPAFKYLAIDGNHDGYFSACMGTYSGRIVQDRARQEGIDWTFLGACYGRTNLYGARWSLWHPHGAASTRNAVRRALNDRAEALTENADVLLCGHFHKYVALPVYPEGIFAVCGGTFQRKGSEFSNRISRAWDVGGTIVSYTVGKDGRAREFSAEFYPYP